MTKLAAIQGSKIEFIAIFFKFKILNPLELNLNFIICKIFLR